METIEILDLALELNEGTLPFGDNLVDAATQRILACNFDVCAISVQCFNFPLVEAIVAQVKRGKNAPKIIYGGHHVALLSDELKALCLADHVSSKTVEEELEVEGDPLRSPESWLAPSPRRYAAVSKVPTGLIEIGRGCPFDCAYCSIPRVFGRRLAFKSAQDISREVQFWLSHGIHNLHLVDDTFTADRRHANDVLEILSSFSEVVTWSAMTRADLVDSELLKKMAAAGCVSILYGVDAGNVSTRRRMSKRAPKYPDLGDLARWNVEAGISPSFYFIIDYVSDTVEDFHESLLQAARMSLVDPGSVRLNLTRINPGTSLGKTTEKLLPNFEAPYADTLKATVGIGCDEVWTLIRDKPALFSTYFCSPSAIHRATLNALARYGNLLIAEFPMTFLVLIQSENLIEVFSDLANVPEHKMATEEQVKSAFSSAVDRFSESGLEFLEFERWLTAGDTKEILTRVDAAFVRDCGQSKYLPSLNSALLRKPRYYRHAAN
ncbi:B12-binding domain-containing radical SAM protein [Rhizobium sp. 10PS4]|uniref:B12-binding domain-containing radical SAM protein n=1 Tax=Rhizobium sp. 10PS4 TaxID=3075621 RepID=UPI0028FDA308|nr:radical SAM protein [Rhizobium sp. 10PS4]MDU0309432.1 radical SAM protein [Rhizobium sp. 10PS4]